MSFKYKSDLVNYGILDTARKRHNVYHTFLVNTVERRLLCIITYK